MLIIEGKKEEIQKRLHQKFEFDKRFIDRILEVDPTGYKYVDYISKQLEKIITQLAGSKGGLTLDQQNAIISILGVVIPWFHNNFNRLTKDDILSAETIFNNRYGDVPNIDGIIKSFKDINQYENPEFIRTLMDIVDSKKSSREKERELKSQAEKLYEDEDVLVIKPKTHAASCYYGSNTKWCTSSSQNTNYFDRYKNMGQLYYFINKKKNIKYALFKNEQDKKIEVYDAQDKEVYLSVLIDNFPNQTDLIDELSGTGDFIKILREFTKGKVDYRELHNSDDAIQKVKVYDPLGQSEIFIELKNDEEFYKILDLSEDDIWFANTIFSPYNDYELYDSYQVKEDFRDGYVIYGDLNENNLKKLKDISEVIIPEEKFDLSNDKYKVKLSDTLMSLFDNEIDNIVYDFAYEKNSEMKKTAQDYIHGEIENFLESLGFSIVRSYDIVKTTAANLLMWSTRLGLKKIDVISLFNQIVSENNINLGNWYDSSYEFQDSNNFDENDFNNSVEIQLDKIMKKIETSMETQGNSIGDFLNLKNKISKKFEFDEWYSLPKSENVSFKIIKLDRDTMKIFVELNAPNKGYKTVKVSEENFYNLLYQPELFDIFDI